MVRTFYFLTLVALVLSILLSCMSAYLRLADSGIGCDPWPACFGHNLVIDQAPGLTIDSNDANRGLRAMHRGLASLLGLVVVLMTVIALWHRKRAIAPTFWTLCAFGVTAMLTIVGLYTPSVEFPTITLLNLAGGVILAALLFHLLLRQRGRTPRRPDLVTAATTGTLVLTLLMVIGGAWVSANFAASACEGNVSCPTPVELNPAAAFSPSRKLVIDAGHLVPDVNLELILYAHQAMAPIVGFTILGCFGLLGVLYGFQRWMMPPPVLLVTTVFLGMLPPGLVAATLHNAVTLLLTLSLVYQVNKASAFPDIRSAP